MNLAAVCTQAVGGNAVVHGRSRRGYVDSVVVAGWVSGARPACGTAPTKAGCCGRKGAAAARCGTLTIRLTGWLRLVFQRTAVPRLRVVSCLLWAEQCVGRCSDVSVDGVPGCACLYSCHVFRSHVGRVNLLSSFAVDRVDLLLVGRAPVPVATVRLKFVEADGVKVRSSGYFVLAHLYFDSDDCVLRCISQCPCPGWRVLVRKRGAADSGVGDRKVLFGPRCGHLEQHR